MAGDAILAIDGLDTAGMASDEAVKHIRGPKDTDVTLTIRRGEDEARDVVITRDTIEIDSVTYQLRDDGIAVITISFFQRRHQSSVHRRRSSSFDRWGQRHHPRFTQ